MLALSTSTVTLQIQMKLILFLFASLVLAADAYSSDKSNCTVSAWSVWSDPYGFGTISRERKVLQKNQNGGKPCPLELVQTKRADRFSTGTETATSLVKNLFLRKKSRTKRSDELRDLLIIFDSSASISVTDFQEAKNQLAQLLGYICPYPDPFNGVHQVALIQFGSYVKEVFDFNDYNNTLEIKQGIRTILRMGGSSCISKALTYAKDVMLQPDKGMRRRSEVKQEVLILTDGQSNCGGNAVLDAAHALQDTADVFALLFGSYSSTGFDDLSNYLSVSVTNHMFSIPGYHSLAGLLDVIENVSDLGDCWPFSTT